MAFYAELKRLNQWGIHGVNWIRWYRKKLYDDWYNSLTPEELEELRKQEEEERRKRNAEYKAALYTLYTLPTIINSMFRRPDPFA